jgi:hypothetical protein
LASCSISSGIYGKEGTQGYLTTRKTPYPAYLVFFRRTLPFILEQCSQELPDVCVGGPITSSDLYTQLLSFEQHTSMQGHSSSASSSAMAASHDRGSTGGRGYGGSDQGRGRGRSSRGGSSGNDWVYSQQLLASL